MNAFGAWGQNVLNWCRNRYFVHQDAVIISCFYNPQGNPYRLIAFQKWYRSIKHLPHRIIECLIGPNAKSQLPKSSSISQVRSDSLLWHKETLLNKIVSELPKEFKYVFWVDADIVFTNPNWIRDSVLLLQQPSCKLLQPFEYCVHLKKNQLKPDFDVDAYRQTATNSKLRHPQLWRSFCFTYRAAPAQARGPNYDEHGHVGFAWGARRELLEACPLYDRALIGGADHIIAHAAVGDIPNSCIRRAFADDIVPVEDWSRKFYEEVKAKVMYAGGDVYHIWHGDVKARDYYKAVPAFSQVMSGIQAKDRNGLYVAGGKDAFVKKHYPRREARQLDGSDSFDWMDPEFFEDMGYYLADLAFVFGQPTYDDPVYGEPNLGDADSFSTAPPIVADEPIIIQHPEEAWQPVIVEQAPPPHEVTTIS